MYWLRGMSSASFMEKYVYFAQYLLGWSSESSPATFDHGIWHQDTPTITLEYKLNTIDPHVHIALPAPRELHIKIEDVEDIHILQASIKWPIEWAVCTDGKVKIRLTKVVPEIWPHIAEAKDPLKKLLYNDFYKGEIIYAFKVSPNGESYHVKMKYANRMFQYVPPGHHVAVKKLYSDDNQNARAYTPVPLIPEDIYTRPGAWRKTDEKFNLLIKRYENVPGKEFYMTPWLCNTHKRRGTRTIYISNVRGAFKNTLFENKNEIYLFAGGTGITPMVGIAIWALQTKEAVKVTLLYFNKTPDSVIWEEQFKLLTEEDVRFKMIEGFSDPNVDITKLDTDVKLEKGRVSPSIIEKYLPRQTKSQHLICICGPPPFTMAVEDHIALGLDYVKGTDYIAFLGKRDPMLSKEEYRRRLRRNGG